MRRQVDSNQLNGRFGLRSGLRPLLREVGSAKRWTTESLGLVIGFRDITEGRMRRGAMAGLRQHAARAPAECLIGCGPSD